MNVPAAGLENINEATQEPNRAIENNQWTNIVHSYSRTLLCRRQDREVLDAAGRQPYKEQYDCRSLERPRLSHGREEPFQKTNAMGTGRECTNSSSKPLMTPSGECDSVVSCLISIRPWFDLCGLPPNDKTQGRSFEAAAGKARSFVGPSGIYL